MFAPKRVLIWYVPPSQDEFNRMSRWHLRMIAYAPVLYATDNHGRLPSMRTWQDAETALIPYAKEPQLFVQPQTGTHYLPNPHLSQCDFIAMSHPEHVLLYSEAQPAPDGKLGVVFADGHTDRLMPMEWKRLWSQAMPRPQADLSSKG